MLDCQPLPLLPVGRAKERGRSRLCDAYEHHRRTMWNYRFFSLFFCCHYPKGNRAANKQNMGKHRDRANGCQEKLEEAIGSWRSLFLFQNFLQMCLIPPHIHSILQSCKDRCKWSFLYRPMRLIDADAINKSIGSVFLFFTLRSIPCIPHSFGFTNSSHAWLSDFWSIPFKKTENSAAADYALFYFGFSQFRKIKELVKKNK